MRLGSTDLSVSELGFGCWQLGGKGWGSYSLRDVVSAIECAVQRGVNLFDTAPVYGFGRSEEILGKTLARLGEECVVISKGGLVWDRSRRITHDCRPESLRGQLMGSLKRLRRDRLDAYVLHWPDPDVPVRESVSSLESLREEGLIRCWGISNFPVSTARSLVESGVSIAFLEQPLNVLEAYPDEHREVARAGRQLLSLASEHGLGVLAFDVLARGFLGRRAAATESLGRKDLRRRDWRFAAENTPALAQARARLERWADEQGEPLTALAVRAVLERAQVTACLVGMKSREQLEENLRFERVDLPDELREK